MRLNKKMLLILMVIVGLYLLFKSEEAKTADTDVEDKNEIEKQNLSSISLSEVEYRCEVKNGELICYDEQGRPVKTIIKPPILKRPPFIPEPPNPREPVYWVQ